MVCKMERRRKILEDGLFLFAIDNKNVIYLQEIDKKKSGKVIKNFYCYLFSIEKKRFKKQFKRINMYEVRNYYKFNSQNINVNIETINKVLNCVGENALIKKLLIEIKELETLKLNI